MEYAKGTYGVEMTIDEATSLRDKLINEIYPELAEYLDDDPMADLAARLDCSEDDLWRKLDFKGSRPRWLPAAVRRVVLGNKKKSGEDYSPRFVDGVWHAITSLNRNPRLAPLLADRGPAEAPADELFSSSVAALTGRVRGNVKFCQARNTPFQGLAVDGAKLALFDLTRAGYRVVNFVHDDVIVELPRDGCDHKAEVAKVVRIMREAMQRVCPDLPVKCQIALSEKWSKDTVALDVQESSLRRRRQHDDSKGRCICRWGGQRT